MATSFIQKFLQKHSGTLTACLTGAFLATGYHALSLKDSPLPELSRILPTAGYPMGVSELTCFSQKEYLSCSAKTLGLADKPQVVAAKVFLPEFAKSLHIFSDGKGRVKVLANLKSSEYSLDMVSRLIVRAAHSTLVDNIMSLRSFELDYSGPYITARHAGR